MPNRDSPWIIDANGQRQRNPDYNPSGGANTRVNPQATTPGVTPSANFGALGTPDLNNFRPFSEATYAEAARVLDPQWEAQRRRFDQDMVNRGISEGTDAYRNAFDNFSRGQNDAYASARNQAMLQGLGAQNQAFNQDFQNRSLQQQGDIASQQLGAQEAARQSSYQQFLEQLNENRRQFDLGFGEDRRRYDTNFGEDRRRWDLGRGDNLENVDFARLMELAGMGMNQAGFNNAASQQEMQNILPWLGLIPNQGPTGIDVLSPFQLNQQGQMANYQQQAQRNNGFWGAIGQMGGAILPFLASSKNLKTGGELADPDAALEAVLAMPVRTWRYKPEIDAEGRIHIGPYAEDFNAALGLPNAPVIHLVDAIGALIGSVQAQAAKIEQLKNELKAANA